MYSTLPKNEKTFAIDILGEDTGLKYQGEFTVRCVLNMAGKHQLELEKTRLMADYANPSRGLAGIAISLATIRARIVKAPDWWEETDFGAEIIDENVILELYDRCVSAENDWRNSVKKKSEEAKEELEKAEEAKEESSGN